MGYTEAEQRLMEYAEKAVKEYNRIRHAHGDVDTLYAFVLSDSGAIFDGASFEPNIAHSNFCGERCAISNLVLKESYNAKIKCVVIADPVPSVQDKSTPPCGTCRHVIHQFAQTGATVISMQYIQQPDDWTFPKAEKWRIEELYPYPYEPIDGLWDNYSAPQP